MVGAAREELPQVRLPQAQAELAGVAAGEHQQVVGDPGEPFRFFGGAADCGGEFLGAAARTPGQLEFPAQHGERGSQLVAGVVDEGAFALERAPEPDEQVVHGPGQGGDLVPRAGDLDAGGVAALGDRRDLPAQPLDG